jgi:membrane protease YdiL (CAAX protease family)
LLQPVEVAVAGLGGQMVLVLGAGIYEELVFRLYLVSGLAWLLKGVCRVPKRAALPAAVVLAALIFAACHLRPIGADTFEWPQFLALTVAGGYLAVVFVVRGLGVATGCHVAYNLVALALSVE